MKWTSNKITIDCFVTFFFVWINIVLWWFNKCVDCIACAHQHLQHHSARINVDYWMISWCCYSSCNHACSAYTINHYDAINTHYYCLMMLYWRCSPSHSQRRIFWILQSMIVKCRIVKSLEKKTSSNSLSGSSQQHPNTTNTLCFKN